MRGLKQKKDVNYRSVIRSLKFLTNSIHPEAQITVHQCARLIADPKLPYGQDFKRVLKYLKAKATQRLILKPDPEKGIECYVDADFAGG